jgi:hypothetical protein
MSGLALFFLLIAGVFAFLLLSGVLYFAMFRTEAVKHRQLRKLAWQQYEEARGTAHRRLLQTARSRALKERGEVQHALKMSKARQAELICERDRELESALLRHIIGNHLEEVSGIGPSLAYTIRASVFKNSLRDLHQAHAVYGVGQQKQAAISQWVHYYEAELPRLREKEYPGKRAIVTKYQAKIEAQTQLVAQLTVEQSAYDQRIAQITQVAAPLENVTVKDFVTALKNPDSVSEQLELYLRGIFAEWEPIPDWFQEIIASQR